MDPRRKTEERLARVSRGKVPFVRSHRERVLEEQPMGPPLERDVLVLRIELAALKLYAALAAFALMLLVLSIYWG